MCGTTKPPCSKPNLGRGLAATGEPLADAQRAAEAGALAEARADGGLAPALARGRAANRSALRAHRLRALRGRGRGNALRRALPHRAARPARQEGHDRGAARRRQAHAVSPLHVGGLLLARRGHQRARAAKDIGGSRQRTASASTTQRTLAPPWG